MDLSAEKTALARPAAEKTSLARVMETALARLVETLRSPAARRQITNLLICLSLGNLCFLRRWYDLEHLQERAVDYYRTGPETPALLIATVASACLLSLAFYAAWLWVERWPTQAKLRVAQCGFLLVLMFPLESVRKYWNTEGNYDLTTNIVILCLEAILAGGAVLALKGNPRVVGAARRIALLLTLLFPSLFLDFSWGRVAAEPASAYRPRPPAAMQTHPAGKRVVWVLFDELDQRLAFDLRQPKVDLPELDRLRAESFTASAAEQTAGWTTLAVPSLLSGTIFERAELRDATTLEVLPEGSKTEANWRDEPNVFKRARAARLNAALIGWHHPYCRILGDELVKCVAVPSGDPTPSMLRETSAGEIGALRSIPLLFAVQWTNLRDVFRTGPSESESAGERDEYAQQRQQRQYFKIRDLVYATASDPNIDLLFAHFPLPHPFAIYNARRHDFTLSRQLTYADNLALVDRTVGELRRALEQAGLWDSTTIVITSDHGLRPDLWRGRMGWTPELERLTGGKQTPLVPLIVKVAGAHDGVAYSQPFSSVVESKLVMAALRGQLKSAADVAAWIDQCGETGARSDFSSDQAPR